MRSGQVSQKTAEQIEVEFKIKDLVYFVKNKDFKALAGFLFQNREKFDLKQTLIKISTILIEEGDNESLDFLVKKYSSHVKQESIHLAKIFDSYNKNNTYKIKDELNKLSPNYALHGYVILEDFFGFNEQMKKSEISVDYAISCLENHSYIKPSNALCLLSSIDNENVRKQIAGKFKKEHLTNDSIKERFKADSTAFLGGVEAAAFMRNAGRLNQVIREHHLNFFQIQPLKIPGLREWLLQGPQLVQRGWLINDLFFSITGLIVGFSVNDTKLIFMAVHRKLFADMTASCQDRFTLFQITADEYIEQNDNAKKRYQDGISPIIKAAN